MAEVVDRGLEDVVAVSSEICSIVDGVLSYRGYNIDELAGRATFEEVVFLLWHGRLPRRDEWERLRRDLAKAAPLPRPILDLLKTFPKTATPMEVLRTAVSALSIHEPAGVPRPEERDGNLAASARGVARIPTVVATFDRLRRGAAPVEPRADLGFAANFLYALKGEAPDDVSVEALDTALVLHADHELNASTFAARVTAATLSDLVSAVVSAIGTLKGPLHGGANEQVMSTLEEIGGIDRLDAWVDQALAQKRRIMGFGHRVYKDGDPRAKHLKRMSKALGERVGETKWYEMSARLEALVLERKRLKPNVDFYSASVYHTLGFPRDLFTPIFAVSRASGWTAHVMEQYANNRLIRPRADYRGPTSRKFVPFDQR